MTLLQYLRKYLARKRSAGADASQRSHEEIILGMIIIASSEVARNV